jgi:hypothetical protein
MPHFLAPPFALPDAGDARLLYHLEQDDWTAATTLLREVVKPDTTHWKWLVLLAYVRFRDASDVMPDELTDASREGVSLLSRAMELGAPYQEVAPFLDVVERTLDQLSRGEEALLAKLGEDDRSDALTDEELESVAFLLDKHAPQRAMKLFEALQQRAGASEKSVAWAARAALSCVRAQSFEAAKPALEAVLTADWSKQGLSGERLTLEAVETELLEQATGDEFNALWLLAVERGSALAFPFPSAWPHQERLFARCVALHDLVRARTLAQRMEDERQELPSWLKERFVWVRLSHV